MVNGTTESSVNRLKDDSGDKIKTFKQTVHSEDPDTTVEVQGIMIVNRDGKPVEFENKDIEILSELKKITAQLELLTDQKLLIEEVE